MTLGQIQSLAQYHLDDLGGKKYDPTLYSVFINEGLRLICTESLLLEKKNSSLTYSSDNGGFTLPTDFIRVKKLIWVDPSSGNHNIPHVSLDQVLKLKNDWLLLNDSAGQYLHPLGYTINYNTIILDSTTQTSPTLYYYYYDVLADTDSVPAIASEFHSALAHYAVFKLTDDQKAFAIWHESLNRLRAHKFKNAPTARARYIGL